MSRRKEVHIKDLDERRYSDILLTTYCQHCGVSHQCIADPKKLKQYLRGNIDSVKAFSNRMKDENAFLIAFKICVKCNGGYEIKDIECYPGHGGEDEKIR